MLPLTAISWEAVMAFKLRILACKWRKVWSCMTNIPTSNICFFRVRINLLEEAAICLQGLAFWGRYLIQPAGMATDNTRSWAEIWTGLLYFYAYKGTNDNVAKVIRWEQLLIKEALVSFITSLQVLWGKGIGRPHQNWSSRRISKVPPKEIVMLTIEALSK